jgi:hypothetical protein
MTPNKKGIPRNVVVDQYCRELGPYKYTALYACKNTALQVMHSKKVDQSMAEKRLAQFLV